MSWSDLPIIFTISLLEILLSADNAVVLAALAQTLEVRQQKKALFYGLIGAFVLRLIAIIGARWIIKLWYLQAIGGLYLVWLGLNHLVHRNKNDAGDLKKSKRQRSFLEMIVAIELTDLIFAIDSILAAVGLSSNLWVIYVGAMIGIIAMRFAAAGVLKLLRIFPSLILYAYVIVIWIGIKLGWEGVGSVFREYMIYSHMPKGMFWVVMAIICTIAFIHGFQARYKRS
jgi:YkoY family integral membrane protein